MKKIYFLWSLLGLLTLHMGWAQSNITGTVNDETGAPLPGATVIVEGTTRGVATDFDGNFSIQATQGDVLVITYVGYAEQRITIGDEDSYSIRMELRSALEEIIVTGQGSGIERRKLSTTVDVLLENVSASAFTQGESGFPEYQYSISANTMLSTLNLSADQIDGGDLFVLRYALNLTDGRTFSTANTGNNVRTTSHNAPFRYSAVVVCFKTPEAGNWTLEMEDVFGDGWNGASISVSIAWSSNRIYMYWQLNHRNY